MATTSSLSRDNSFGIARAIHSLRERCIETVSEWRQRSHSRRDLLTLGEHELRDIRLTQLDAISEARKPFWRK